MAYIYNLTDTWNAAGTTFAGIKMVVTNTASGANSALLDLSVSGATTGYFIVDKNANLSLTGKINKYTFTAPATGATLALADGSTLTTVGGYALTLTTTGATNLTLPTSGTLTTTANNLGVFASTTSAQLAGVISDETGSGSLVFSTSPTLVTPILGTPTSGTLTNCTGYTVGNLSGLGTGVATFLATPSSTNLAAAVTDETGSGSLVFSTSPTLTTPNLGTPSAVTLTNATGLPISTGVSGLGTGVATFLATPTSANLAAAVTNETGSGALVFATSPTLTTPNLGTPSALTLTNATGLPVGGISATGTPSISTYLRGDGSWATVSSGSGDVTGPASSTDNAVARFDGITGKIIQNSAVTIADTTGDITGGKYNGLTISTTTGTLTVANAKTFALDNSVTMVGTDSSTVNFGAGGTIAYTGGTLAQFASTTSSQLAGVISDETGSGPLVFATSPTFTSAITLGTASTTQGSLVLANTSANSVTLKSNNSTSAAYTLTMPTTAGTNGYFLQTDGLGNLAWAAGGGGGGGSVAGSDTQVQFNDAGSFGADPGFTFAKASDALTLGVQQTSQGSLVLANTAAGVYSTTLKASNSASAAWTFTLPVTAGSNGQVLVTDGTGVTSWSTFSANLAVGTTSISSGTSGRILYDNAGTLGEKTVTGTGDVVLATSPTLVTPALGTPSSGTLTNCTGYTVGNISGLGTGVATFLATPSSANLAAAVTDETGSGSLVFATSPTLVTPALGTPTSGNFSTGTFTWPTFNQNTTGTAANVSGIVAITNGGTGQSTKAAAYNALSPMTTLGDTEYSDGTNAVRLAGNTTTTKQFLSQTGTGTVSAAPSWSAVTKSDVGLANVENTALSTWAGSTNITTLGTVATGTWSATTIAVNKGGTGLTSGTSGGILYYSATGTLASSAALAANALVVGGGAGVAPSTVTTGTGVVTALGVNTGTAGAFVVNGGALGTPSSGTLTSCTGLPISTGVSGLASGAATFLATPTSANLAALLTDETGSGANVFATSPTLVTPTLGVASATSINKVALTAPATGSTLTIADGKTLTASNSLTLAGTDSTTMTFPSTSSTVLTTGNTATITKGFTVTPNSITTGNFTVDPSLGNYQYVTNNGAYTITAPASDCAVDILVTNGASAGATTFSGFTVGSSTGSALTTTNTNKFLVSVRRINSVSTYSIYALQ